MHWKRRGARPPWPLCWLAHAYTEYTQSSLNFRPWGPRLFSLRGRSVTEKSQFRPYHFLAIWWSAPSHFSHWSLPWNEQPMGRQDFEANANERQDTSTCNMKKINLKCEDYRMSTAFEILHRRCEHDHTNFAVICKEPKGKPSGPVGSFGHVYSANTGALAWELQCVRAIICLVTFTQPIQ